MRDIAKQIFDRAFPTAEELWALGNAEIVPVEIDPGHVEDVPFFDLDEPVVKVLDDKEFITRSGRKIGREILHRIDINGIDHLGRAFVPDEKYRSEHDLTITSGAAWLTTIDGGYAADRSRKLFADDQQGLLQVGSPHSATVLPAPLEFLRVPQTYTEAQSTSLARTAQIEQLAFATLSRMYDLSNNQVPIGDSRDANTTAGQYPYAKQYGANIVDFDNKGRSALHRLELKDLPRFAAWLATTGMGGVAVAMCLAKDGQLGTLVGTSSLNPNFLTSSFTGTMRGLASGETGKMIDWVPRDTHGIDVVYGRDVLTSVEDVEEAWSEHPNVYVKNVRGGTHPALLHPLAHSGRRTRMRSRTSEFKSNNGQVDLMDWDKIHGKKKSATLKRVA